MCVDAELHVGRSMLDLDESTVDEYLELCQRGLLRPETLRSGMDGMAYGADN
jgi:hypothetical protein